MIDQAAMLVRPSHLGLHPSLATACLPRVLPIDPLSRKANRLLRGLFIQACPMPPVGMSPQLVRRLQTTDLDRAVIGSYVASRAH